MTDLTPPEIFGADLDLACTIALQMHDYDGVVRQLLDTAARFAKEGNLKIATTDGNELLISPGTDAPVAFAASLLENAAQVLGAAGHFEYGQKASRIAQELKLSPDYRPSK